MFIKTSYFTFLSIIVLGWNFNFLMAQSIEEKCRYYPLHIGDEWHYKIETYESGTEPTISYSNRIVKGDTLLPNGFRYFVIEEDSSFAYERIDSAQLKVMKYEPNTCVNDKKDIYSLDFDPSTSVEWIDCSGTPWEVTFFSSGEIMDSSYIKLYSDWLLTVENHLVKDWGLRYHFSGEGNSYYKYLISAKVNGRSWGVSAINHEIKQPSGFNLLTIYPNPFNAATTVQFNISNPADVQISVCNVSGQLVYHTKLSGLKRGTHKFKWDGTHYSSGIYIFRIRNKEQVVSRKVVLLK